MSNFLRQIRGLCSFCQKQYMRLQVLGYPWRTIFIRLQFTIQEIGFHAYDLGMQSQLVCAGCRNLLLYARGAANVCCALCNTITPVPPPGMEMAQLVCVGCRTLLMYTRGATNVRCSCCNTINPVRAANPVAYVNCGRCQTTLMYPYGAPSVKCAVCNFVTDVGSNNMRIPIPLLRPNGSAVTPASMSGPLPHTHSQTVVVENPMSVDESGKLVSNVVVGVTADKK